jgi:CubicO group peptidase (beta-lactamase class C family)
MWAMARNAINWWCWIDGGLMTGKWDWRQVRLGIAGFFAVFLISLVALKPYLLTAAYRNFATIYDYRHFENRRISASEAPEPFLPGAKTLEGPAPGTLQLLSDLKTTALLVLQDGQLVYEKYSLDGGSGVLSGSFSMAKSIVALLTGVALQEGRIKSLDEPIENYLPEWQGREEGRIRIRDLAQMTSGLNWDESYWNPFSVTAEAYYGTQLLQTALRQRLASPPGSLFSYQSGTTQLLGIALSRAVNMSLSEYASRKLWRPLHAEADALWSLDHPQGIEKAYCCFNARARDFARIGELVLNRGSWKGTPVVDSGFIDQMVTPHRILNEHQEPVDYYGFQWWLLKTPFGLVPYARGILGQYIVVIPQRRRVMVRLGKATGERTDHHPVELRALVEWGLRD